MVRDGWAVTDVAHAESDGVRGSRGGAGGSHGDPPQRRGDIVEETSMTLVSAMGLEPMTL